MDFLSVVFSILIFSVSRVKTTAIIYPSKPIEHFEQSAIEQMQDWFNLRTIAERVIQENDSFSYDEIQQVNQLFAYSESQGEVWIEI
jgi:hypothetical protein